MEYFNGLMVEWVEKTANKYPDNTAYEFTGKKVKYKKFIEDIHLYAKGLLQLGVQKGDRIAIIMPNTPQTLTFLYAANKIGAVVNMIHPLSSPDELLKYLTLVEAKHAIVFDQLYLKIKKICDKTPIENIITTGIKDALSPLKKAGYAITQGKNSPKIKDSTDAAVKVITFPFFLKIAQSHNDEIKLPLLKDYKDKMAVILYSGGTTGKTKGICLSNYAINCSATQLIERNNLQPGDAFLSVMPMFHGNGLVGGGHVMLVTGGKCVLIPRFSPEICVKELYKHKCAFISGSPTLLEKMMKCDLWKGRDLSFLKSVVSGADALPVELEKQLDEFFKSLHANLFIRQGYGLTEGVVASSLMKSTEKKYGSIGPALEGVSMKIVEPDTEKELPVGEVGEIVFTSETNMMGYYNDPEETANVMKMHSDGKTWIHSKDLGYMDEDGYFFFKGRIKRLIVTSGYNVLPLELEEQINKCGLVEKCCIKGVPDKVRIEMVKAYIKLKPGIEKNEATKDAIMNYCKEHIARYAIPREIEFTDSFPTTRIGKIDYNRIGN